MGEKSLPCVAWHACLRCTRSSACLLCILCSSFATSFGSSKKQVARATKRQTLDARSKQFSGLYKDDRRGKVYELLSNGSMPIADLLDVQRYARTAELAAKDARAKEVTKLFEWFRDNLGEKIKQEIKEAGLVPDGFECIPIQTKMGVVCRPLRCHHCSAMKPT